MLYRQIKAQLLYKIREIGCNEKVISIVKEVFEPYLNGFYGKISKKKSRFIGTVFVPDTDIRLCAYGSTIKKVKESLLYQISEYNSEFFVKNKITKKYWKGVIVNYNNGSIRNFKNLKKLKDVI